ncbi:M15 family metallopeptidase [Cellulomonas sp. P5_C6]
MITSLNGRVPHERLANTPTGQPLLAEAVAALVRLSAAAVAAGQGQITMQPLKDFPLAGYRTFDEQDHLHKTNKDAIKAGQSIHSEGIAADLALDGFDGTRYAWLLSHGEEFGWYKPTWAFPHGSHPESWHWEYDPEADQHRNEEEDDMPFSRQELKIIIAETMRENIGDLAPGRASWGPPALADWAHKGVAELFGVDRADPEFQLGVYERNMSAVMANVLKSEGVSGAADVSRLVSALVPLLQSGAAGLSDEEFNALRSSVEHARNVRGGGGGPGLGGPDFGLGIGVDPG